MAVWYFHPTGGGNILFLWGAGNYPSGASMAAVASNGATITAFGPNPDDLPGIDTQATWIWTSSQTGGNVTVGTQLAIGQIIPLESMHPFDHIRVRALVQVNATDRLSEFLVGVRGDGTDEQTDILSNLSDGVWYEINEVLTPITGWDGPLQIILAPRGTVTSTDVGITIVAVKWLEVELMT